jgi:hypothetical protein
MLSHSPPLPLIINYHGRRTLSTKDEEGALLALQKHDLVRYIHLCASTTTLDKLFATMNGPFPLLDDLGLFVENSDPNGDESEVTSPTVPDFPNHSRPHIFVSLI